MLSVLYLVVKKKGCSQEEKEWTAKPPVAKQVSEGGWVGCGWVWVLRTHTCTTLFDQGLIFGGEGRCIKQFSIHSQSYLSFHIKDM